MMITADVARTGETTMIVTEETIAVMIGAAIGAAVIAMVAMVIVMVIRETVVMTAVKSAMKKSEETETTGTGEEEGALLSQAATTSAADETKVKAMVGATTAFGTGPVPIALMAARNRKAQSNGTKS
jgi:hypothetical protein